MGVLEWVAVGSMIASIASAIAAARSATLARDSIERQSAIERRGLERTLTETARLTAAEAKRAIGILNAERVMTDSLSSMCGTFNGSGHRELLSAIESRTSKVREIADQAEAYANGCGDLDVNSAVDLLPRLTARLQELRLIADDSLSRTADMSAKVQAIVHNRLK